MKARYQSKVVIPAVLILLLCLAYLDYLTGHEFSLFPLYLLPLALIAWNEGLRATLGVFAVAAFCISVKAVLEHQDSGSYWWYWDTFIKIILLILLPFGLWKIKHLLHDLRQAQEELRKINDSLEQTVAARTEQLALTLVDLQEKELLLMQQSRLAAMGEMIGNIAHQWRQPLNRLGLLVQDILVTSEAGMIDRSYLEEHVEKTMETIHHMSQTVEDFRNFFKPDKEKTTFRVIDAIATTMSLLQEGLRPLQVETIIEQVGEPVVIGYPNEYSQVLINIIGNAKDAFASRRTKSPVLRFSAWTAEGTTFLTITDNAGGIPQEIMSSIFEPYFSTKGPKEGTGLGLYMSRMIVERNMKGSLAVRNVDGGAEFEIAVPAC